MVSYTYPRPIIVVDAVIHIGNSILVIKRKNEPYKNMWALPGGYVGDNESTTEAIIREVEEETSLRILDEPQLIDVYDDKYRDPRNKYTISIAYSFKINKTIFKPIASDDAKELKLIDKIEILYTDLAFDHNKILVDYLISFNRMSR